ncbi:hypothetical protein ACXWRC_09255, partial [Streptococcus pyogenes]
CTIPDLSICVNIPSRYSSKMNKELWQNINRVLRYLNGTIDLKLVFETNNYKDELIGYVDSDCIMGTVIARSTATASVD